MPLSKAGDSILRDMIKKHGAKKGKAIFYATANKNPAFAKHVGEKK